MPEHFARLLLLLLFCFDRYRARFTGVSAVIKPKMVIYHRGRMRRATTTVKHTHTHNTYFQNGKLIIHIYLLRPRYQRNRLHKF